jgi:DNA-binding transcriptional MocR family regulator
MVDALEGELPSARWSRPEGGYFIWLELPDHVSAADLLDGAESAGVAFVSGSDFFPPGAGGQSAIRLAYSFEAPERIEEGVTRLAGLLAPLAQRPAAPV